jgi:hypothetical protein
MRVSNSKIVNLRKEITVDTEKRNKDKTPKSLQVSYEKVVTIYKVT